MSKKLLANGNIVYEKYALAVVPLILKIEGAISVEEYENTYRILLGKEDWPLIYALVLSCRTALVSQNDSNEQIGKETSMRVEIAPNNLGTICKSIW